MGSGEGMAALVGITAARRRHPVVERAAAVQIATNATVLGIAAATGATGWKQGGAAAGEDGALLITAASGIAKEIEGACRGREKRKRGGAGGGLGWRKEGDAGLGRALGCDRRQERRCTVAAERR